MKQTILCVRIIVQLIGWLNIKMEDEGKETSETDAVICKSNFVIVDLIN